jgi:hypothetical protein
MFMIFTPSRVSLRWINPKSDKAKARTKPEREQKLLKNFYLEIGRKYVT